MVKSPILFATALVAGSSIVGSPAMAAELQKESLNPTSTRITLVSEKPILLARRGFFCKRNWSRRRCAFENYYWRRCRYYFSRRRCKRRFRRRFGFDNRFDRFDRRGRLRRRRFERRRRFDHYDRNFRHRRGDDDD